MAAPETSGFECFTQARLSAWRVAKLSEQSRTTSVFSTSENAFSAVILEASATTSTSGLKAFRVARAASTLTAPTDSVP
jgi:hypothetical protein